MRTKLSDAAKIKRLAERNEWSFRYNYSGRGMFGDTCPAIVCGRVEVNKVSSAVRKLGIKHSCSFESMGFDAVVYWPHLESDPSLEPAPEPDDPEDDDE